MGAMSGTDSDRKEGTQQKQLSGSFRGLCTPPSQPARLRRFAQSRVRWIHGAADSANGPYVVSFFDDGDSLAEA